MIRQSKNLTDGLIVGLNKHKSKVIETVDKLATNIIVTAGKSMDKSPVVNNYYNTSSSNAYNLGVTTSAKASDVINNFNLLQVMT